MKKNKKKLYDFGNGHYPLSEEDFKGMMRSLEALYRSEGISKEEFNSGMYKIKNRKKYLVDTYGDAYNRAMNGL